MKGRPLLPKRGSRGREGGFTLLEILAALVVLGVALYIVTSVFSAGLDLAQANRSRKVGAALAEEYLADLLERPDQYVWDLKGPVGELRAISLGGEGERPVTGPTAQPLRQRAAARERNFYDRFAWDAYARVPEEGADFVEVTVVVRWAWAGHEEAFALTSAVPRGAVEGVG